MIRGWGPHASNRDQILLLKIQRFWPLTGHAHDDDESFRNVF